MWPQLWRLWLANRKNCCLGMAVVTRKLTCWSGRLKSLVSDPTGACLVYDAPQATDRKQSPDATGASLVLCDFFAASDKEREECA